SLPSIRGRVLARFGITEKRVNRRYRNPFADVGEISLRHTAHAEINFGGVCRRVAPRQSSLPMAKDSPNRYGTPCHLPRPRAPCPFLLADVRTFQAIRSSRAIRESRSCWTRRW